MEKIFAVIYEAWFGIYDQSYDLIFTHLFQDGGLNKIGWLFILIPLFVWFLFYFVWKYPYARFIHWIICLLLTIVIVGGSTYGTSYTEIFSSNNQALNDALADASTGYAEYAKSLPLKYALANCTLVLIIGCLYSYAMKRFSKIQMHLPF